jgi:hypothetical protein
MHGSTSELFINECEKRILTYLDEVAKFYINNPKLETSYISKPWLYAKLSNIDMDDMQKYEKKNK